MAFDWGDQQTTTATAPPPKTGGGFSWDTDPNRKQLDAAKAAADYQAAKENEAAVAARNQPEGQAWTRAATGAWEGLKALNPFGNLRQTSAPSTFDIATAGLGPIPRMVRNAAEQYQAFRKEGQGMIPSVGAAGAGLVGLNAEDIKNRAQRGDVAGVIGEGIPAIAATLIGGESGRIPKMREAAAGKMLTKEGELTPGTKAAAKAGGMAVGGAAGELLGHPWIGGLMGERLGPAALKMLLGERKPGMPEMVPGGEAKPGPVSVKPFELTPPPEVREEPVQSTFQFPMEQKGEPITRMGRQIEEAAGVPKLQPNIPIGEQLPPFGGKVTFRNPRLLRTPEVEAGRMQRPEGFTGPTSKAGGIPEMIPEEVGRQMGAPPLEANVPLREQFKPRPEAPPSRQVTLEEKYPDKAVRQMVHANGEEIVQAVGDDKELMQQVHDLTNPDVREAMIGSGEDMGQRSIGNRKATGNQITRQEAFKKMLDKGLTPKQIVDLAKRTRTKEPEQE